MHRGGGYLLKFKRASDHLKDLEAKITEWSEQSSYKVFNEPDPDKGPDRFRVRISPDIPPIDPFAVITGDVVHSLRSTLDHLALELLMASHHPNVPSDEILQDSQFPIVGNENSKGIPRDGESIWNSCSPIMIGGIHPDAKPIIDGLQPYHRGNHYKSHPLWILRDLSNIDKHRLLLAGVLSNAGAILRPDGVKNAILDQNIEVRGGFVEGETIIVRYGAKPIDPAKEMRVDFDAWLNIAFKCGSLADGKSVLTTITEIRNFMESDIINPLKKYAAGVP